MERLKHLTSKGPVPEADMGPGQETQRQASEGQEVVHLQRLLFIFNLYCVRSLEGKSSAHPLVVSLE